MPVQQPGYSVSADASYNLPKPVRFFWSPGRPASQGTGIIAGGPVRAVVELAGYTDILSKSLGSRTPINMVRATMEGLASLKTVNQVAELRDKKVEEIFG